MQQDSEEDPLCDGVLFLSPGTRRAYDAPHTGGGLW